MSWMVQTKIPLFYKFIISTISEIPVSDLKPGFSFLLKRGKSLPTWVGKRKMQSDIIWMNIGLLRYFKFGIYKTGHKSEG